MREIMKKPHILIVDDDPLNVKRLEAALRHIYEISVANNGRECIQIAASENTPDLILLDIMMPEMDGYETCRQLKAENRTRGIPVIFITALNDAEQEIKGIDLGAVDYIAKPFNTTIVKSRVKNHIELKRHRDRLAENEKTLRTIMDTIETGGMIIDVETYTILDANRFAAKLIGCEKERLRGRDCREFMSVEALKSCYDSGSFNQVEPDDCSIKTIEGSAIHVRRTFAKIKIKNRECYLVSFLDITDIKDLLKKQEMNINQAKKILGFVNGKCPRYIELSDELVLFIDAVSVPCYAEGGDHFFVRTLGQGSQKGSHKSILSLKDQSGHEVGCVLRSIYTDILHKSIVCAGEGNLEKSIDRLNDEICHSELFDEDDFFTAIIAEIDHSTRILRFVSAGHPPFLLIRGDTITEMPKSGGAGVNLPMAVMGGIRFSADEIKLQEGDKLLFYTDGLSEMPFKQHETVLTIEKMKHLVADMIDGKLDLSASEIMEGMLKKVAAISHEEIVPPLKNSSGDDVTLLCMEVENKTNCRQERLTASTCDELERKKRKIYQELEREWHRLGYSSPETRLQSVLEEAILNAWKHGNKKDPDKTIILRWRYGNDFHLQIIDEGDGFDYENIPDPTSAENRVKPTGRGLFIIRYYADSIFWKKNGSHLVVRFRKQNTNAHK